VAVDRQTQAEAKRLARQIASTGMVLPGSLAHRAVRCGRQGCHCHAEPPQLHGPYWWWTRKVRSKTVTRLLTDEQAAEYGPWFENMKALRLLLEQLEALSVNAVESDPRSARRPGGRKPRPPVDEVRALR
jgi:hypothetical protein